MWYRAGRKGRPHGWVSVCRSRSCSRCRSAFGASVSDVHSVLGRTTQQTSTHWRNSGRRSPVDAVAAAAKSRTATMLRRSGLLDFERAGIMAACGREEICVQLSVRDWTRTAWERRTSARRGLTGERGVEAMNMEGGTLVQCVGALVQVTVCAKSDSDRWHWPSAARQRGVVRGPGALQGLEARGTSTGA
jgi:hypothetical protein